MKEYKKLLNKIKENEKNVYFIHYSCQNLSDDNEGFSPRITSIAVLHRNSYQMSSFSIHLVAERMKISREKICDKYDLLESQMLSDFFAFVEKRINNGVWLHWNMSNINYGFEALAHRYEILTGKQAITIEENRKYNISRLLSLRYGKNYVADPKMKSLMDLNNCSHRNFLSGAEEVSAFKANEFVKLHNSTMCKVYFFCEVMDKVEKNTLRTDKNGFKFRVNELSQNPIVQLIGILGIIITILGFIYNVIMQCHLVNQFQIKIQWFSFRESHCFFSSKT